MRRLSLFLPIVLVVAAACGQSDGPEANRIGGGVGSGRPDDSTCSGLAPGAYCPPVVPGGTPDPSLEVEPGEFLPAAPCVFGDPIDLACKQLGMVCQPGNFCAAPGLQEDPVNGVSMTPGAPPADSSSLWVAVSGQNQVVKVDTRTTPPTIVGRYPSSLDYQIHTAYSMGFTGTIGAGAGQIEITNWSMTGPGINAAQVPTPIPLNLKYRTVRNGTAKISGSTLLVADTTSTSGAAWYRLPQNAWDGFDTTFTFRNSSTNVAGFSFSVQNDGNSARTGGVEGYKSDLSVSFNQDTGAVRTFFWGTGDTAVANAAVASTVAHTARVVYDVPPANRFAVGGSGLGTLTVYIDGAVVTTRSFSILAKLASPGGTNDGDSGVYNGSRAPSRTAVDGNEDAFVANRSTQGTVTKIAGNTDAAHCVRDVPPFDGFALSETSTSDTAFGQDDECILYTTSVGGNNAITGWSSQARGLAISANDFDSGPAGSVWVGHADSLNGQNTSTTDRTVEINKRPRASKLRNSDGYELAIFDLALNPYGSAITGDGKVWYTSGHNGTSLQYIDERKYNDTVAGLHDADQTQGCDGQDCVSPAFMYPDSSQDCTASPATCDTTNPAATPKNYLSKTGSAYCHSVFYGVSVDQYDNVWNVSMCSDIARFTPPGRQRVDKAAGIVAGAKGHWDTYRIPGNSIGVFVTAAKPDDPLVVGDQSTRARVFAGTGTVTEFDAITMSNSTTDRIQYNGTLGGHGGLGFDADGKLWRVGNNWVSGFDPLTQAKNATNVVGTLSGVGSVDTTGGTYTYSDFTGYTRANITSRQVNLDRLFTSNCGDNSPKRWTRLKWTGEVPNGTQLEFRIMTANSFAAAQAAVQSGTWDAGPFYMTPAVPPDSSTAPANTNDSGVWLAPLVGGNVNQVVAASEFVGVRVSFISDDPSLTPFLRTLEVEGICEGLAVPPCTDGAPTCGGTCGKIAGCTVDAPNFNRTTCGSCPTCGNGTTEVPEVCDDGNSVTETVCPGAPPCTICRSDCRANVTLTPGVCGDGIRNGTEVCDDGNVVTETSCPYGSATCAQACKSDCLQILTLPSGGTCGDGIPQVANEVCDDGNTVTETACPYGSAVCGAACRADCQATLVGLPSGGVCGDGIVQAASEACDDRNVNACGLCAADCQSLGYASPASILTAVRFNRLDDNDFFTLNDGVHAAVEFEFDTAGNGVTAGRIAIPVVSADNTSTLVADRIVTAVNSVGAALAIDATILAGGTLELKTDSTMPGQAGNAATISESVTDTGFSVTAFSAGTGARNCPGGTSCSSPNDCGMNSCVGNLCANAVCGDGIVAAPEVCDDRNNNNCGMCNSGCLTTGTVEANATMVAVRYSRLNDGERFTINDGTHTVVFEFDKDGGGVSAGNVRVRVDDSALTDVQIAALMRAAINNVGNGLWVVASGTTATITLTADRTFLPGMLGTGLTATETVSNTNFKINTKDDNSSSAFVAGSGGRDCGSGIACSITGDCAAGKTCVAGFCSP